MKTLAKNIYIALLAYVIFAAGASTYAFSPQGGEVYSVNDCISFTWENGEFQSNVDIRLWSCVGSYWVDVANNLDVSDCEFQWTVPQSLSSGVYRVCISDNSQKYGLGSIRIKEANISMSANKKDETSRPADVELSVFPIPLRDHINISLKSEYVLDVEFGIYDMQGRLLANVAHLIGSGENIVNIPMNLLPAGRYILICKDKNKVLLETRYLIKL